MQQAKELKFTLDFTKQDLDNELGAPVSPVIIRVGAPVSPVITSGPEAFGARFWP